MNRFKKLHTDNIPNHIALILDGNGRWAKRRGRSRSHGHRQGALNVKTVAQVAQRFGVNVLSVYAFSTENWKRPQEEIDYLMKLPKSFEDDSFDELNANDVRIVFSGRRDRIDTNNFELMKKLENKTKNNVGLTLNICFDYGSHDELTQATKTIAQKVKDDRLSIEDITEDTMADHLYTKGLPPVDLMIRTSGEQRLSNYLLWQNAYAEFYFTKTPWPAFKEKQLKKAILNYQKRGRRFGGLKG